MSLSKAKEVRKTNQIEIIFGLLLGLSIVMMIAGLYMTAVGLSKQSK